MKKLAPIGLAAVLFCMVAAGAGFALTPAGTRIYNKAAATYEYNTQRYTVESNQVYTDVLPIYGLVITPDGTTAAPGQEQTATPGATVYYPYTLTNTGNTDDTYNLDTAVDGGNTFAPASRTIYLDANQNGVVDPGERVITNTGTVHADESIHLIVAYGVPGGALATQFALVNLTGQSTHDGAVTDANNWNRTTVTSGAVLTIHKSASPARVNPGGVVNYTVSGINAGNAATTARAFNNMDTTGDGAFDAGLSGILIKDAIPAHSHITGTAATDFGAVSPAGATKLYGYTNNNWSTSGNVAGWGGTAAINKVGMFIPGALAKGQAYEFNWNAVVDADAPAGNISNQATVDWADGAGNRDDSPSNTTLTAVNAIRGIQIGPKGDPAGAGTGSYLSPDPAAGPNTINYAADVSTAAFASCGVNGSQTIVFTNTLKNTGTSADTFNIATSWSANEIPGSVVRVFKSDGLTPLVDTNGDGAYDTGELAAGAEYNIVVKIFTPTTVPCDSLNHDLITAVSVHDSTITNTTVDRILFGPNMWDPLSKTVLPSGDVPPGMLLRFTNTFGNAGGFPATNAVIEDVMDVRLINPANITGLPPATIPDMSGINPPIAVSAVFTPNVPAGSGGTITWTFPVVPAGFRGEVSFDVFIDPTTPDATVINNTVSMTGTGLPTVTSNATVNTVVAENTLVVEKQANKDIVEPGDYLKYTITAKNVSKTMTISAPVRIVDALPRGFRYVSGTSRLDGNPVSDPVISSGGKVLTWTDIGSIAPQSQKQLTYVAIVAADADKGDGINRVTARGRSSSGTPMDSNEATAKVKVDKGVFRDCQTIIGKVFIDDNDNKIQDEGEIRVPGIRLYLEDGTFTVTDSEGKYHFECIKPGTHVIKVDKISLPEGMEVDGVNNRAMGDTDSQFVDLKKGGLFKANFRIKPKGIEKETVRILLMPKMKKEARLETRKVLLTPKTKKEASLKTWKEMKIICYFKTDSADLTPIAKAVIDSQFESLKDISELKVSVEGHADSRQTHKWKGGNEELSHARAKSVADYLQSKYHIKKEKIEIRGWGAQKPLVKPEKVTDETLQPNRPVEIIEDETVAAAATAESAEISGRKATVRVKKGMVGPLQNAYLVIPAPHGVEINANSLQIDGKSSPPPLRFGDLSWIRLEGMDRAFDSKSFDNDRQKIKLKKYEQNEIIEISYLVASKETAPYFIAGVDKDGDVKVFGERAKEEKEQEISKLKERIKGLYIKMHPDLTAKKPAVGAPSSQKEFGILSPDDKAQFLTRDKITLRVRFGLNAHPELKINNAVVDQKSVGKKVFDTKDKTAIFEYVGVPLKPGKNEIEFTWNQDGQKRKDHITVFRAMMPVKIEIDTRPHQLPADGKTEPEVIIKPLDENGLPLPDGIFIDLEMDRGRFITPDANPKQKGYQARITKGAAIVRISSAHKTETRKIKALAGGLQKEKALEFLPYLRDWIIVGIASGTAGYNDIKKSISGDKTDDNDGLFTDGRLAFFAKGTILGKYLLTASYDSDKARDKSRLFQQVEPDKYYPVYGDSSIERYDAESSKKLYVKLARDKNYIMYGDFKTDFTDTETARYDRTFTGADANIETKYLDAKSFWSQTDQTIVKDEIRGDGTSGYYHLTHGDIVENSDRIRIEIRDRHNPSTVISSAELARYSDYWIDYDRGDILFKEPVRSVDGEFNPVYIVVVYETREGAKENDIYGGRAKVKLFDDKVEIGSTGILEKNSVHDSKLYGADIKWRLNKHIEAKGEITRSDVYDTQELDVKKGTSKTASIKADYGKDLKAEARYLNTEEGFRNPSMSSFGGAVEEYTLKGESEYFKGADLKLDASKRKNLETDERLQTAGLEGKYKITDKLEGILGGRYADIHTSSLDQEAELVKAGLSADLTKKLKASLIREQVVSGDRLDSKGFASMGSPFDTFTSTGGNAATAKPGYLATGTNIIGDGYPDRTAAGLEYQLTDKTRLRAVHEWLSGEDVELHRTLFGATSQLGKNISVFGNYGMEDSVDNPRDVANLGIKDKIDITEKLSADVGLERFETVKGRGDDDFTALASSFSYLPDLYKVTGRYELRFGKKETRHLFELGTSQKINADYTFFARERLSYTDHKDSSDEYLNEFLTGLAYRPIRYDKFNFLAKVKLINEKIATGDEDIKLVGSLEANYQPYQPLTLSGKYAMKWRQDSFDGDSYRSFTDLIAARAMYDITDRWVCGVHGGVLHQYDASALDYYIGVETGYRLVKNLWLSVGYNFKGLEDRDFGEGSYHTDGIYITLRFKFDEDTFKYMSTADSHNRNGEQR